MRFIGNRPPVVASEPSMTLTQFYAVVKAAGGDGEALLARAAASASSDLKAAQAQATAASTAITAANKDYDDAVLRLQTARDEKKKVEGIKLDAARLAAERALATQNILGNLGRAPTQS